ncbi:hypothetical protein [Vibrio harveyi]|uniref:hypothetical protein n=1 Tax=Vibrio harveyi TaxID=669 RepID=UPI003CF5F55C
MRTTDINKYFAQCFEPSFEGDSYIVGIDYHADNYERYVFDGILKVAISEQFWEHLEKVSTYSIYPDSISITIQNIDNGLSPLLEVVHKDTKSLLFSKSLIIPSTRKFLIEHCEKIAPDSLTSISLNGRATSVTAKDKPASLMDELAMFSADSNTLKLPSKELSHYSKIKLMLQKAGGIYDKNAFVFETEAQPILDRLLNGETINIKKEFQFFETTDKLSDKLIAKLDLKSDEEWLEPSAGRARIAKKMKEISESGTLIELMPQNVEALKKMGYSPIEADFIEVTTQMLGKQFDKIGANPPFTNDQDIIHIRHMFDEHLKAGGRLSSYASQSWLKGSNKRQVAFKEWLESLDADIELIDEGEFKESGTSIPTTLITIQKAA